jgi:hypothetical protein
MKPSFVMTPVALAIAALLCSPALAGNDKERESSTRPAVEATKGGNAGDSKGGGTVPAEVKPKAESGAIVDGRQTQGRNRVENNIVDNEAVVGGNALRGAQGNIGVNVAGGDDNQQANEAALSQIDAQFVFSSAHTTATQKSGASNTKQVATQNRAHLTGGALAGAQGNIGVNLTAGNGNQQRNDLAASVNRSAAASKATSTGVQDNGGHTTTSAGQVLTLTNETAVTLKGDMNGSYAGKGTIGDTGGNLPPRPGNREVTPGEGQERPATSVVGATAGAALQAGVSANPIYQSSDSNGNADDPLTPTPVPQPIPCEKCDPNPEPAPGASGFSEAGTVKLSGSFTGKVVDTTTAYRPHVNSARLDDGALAGAQGNIGVNIAAGANNQQRNALSISASGQGR